MLIRRFIQPCLLIKWLCYGIASGLSWWGFIWVQKRRKTFEQFSAVQNLHHIFSHKQDQSVNLCVELQK